MVTIQTSTPQALLAAIKKAIDGKRIQTWSYDSDGDFTHTAPQWNRKAWLRPSVHSGTLALSILPPNGTALSKEVYAIYHGRFIEMVLAHFDTEFTSGSATAMPVTSDVVRA
jgi:hypothetical protein